MDTILQETNQLTVSDDERSRTRHTLSTVYQNPRAMIPVHRVHIMRFGGQTRRVESSVHPIASATQMVQYIFCGVIIDIYVFHRDRIFRQSRHVFYASDR
jgi:hypothetical protein